MDLFISFSKKYPAFWISLLFISIVEIILHFIPKLEYLESGGSFFTYYKRNIAENKDLNYDILLYGDSRSLSIKGFNKGDKNFSLYNFSLPAAGPRYVKFFLKKYLDNHNEAPKTVIWAIDPEQYSMEKNKTFDSDKKLWEQYKHRLLNLFSFSESLDQYSGLELLFISKEYLPRIFYTYKYRLGFQDLFTGLKLENFIKRETYHTQQNKQIEELSSKNNGQINLGDYFLATPNQAKEGYEGSFKSLNLEKPYTFSTLEDFYYFVSKNKIKLVVLILPKAGKLYQTFYLKNVLASLREFAKNKKNLLYLEFPNLEYPISDFSEGIHYTNYGAKKLNEEFEKEVLPQIIEFTGKNHEE